MKKNIFLVAFFILLSNSFSAPNPPAMVRVLLFCDSTEKSCDFVRQGILPPFKDQFPSLFEYSYFDTHDSTAIDYFHKLESAFHDSCNFFPAVFIKDRFINGRTNIEHKLKNQIDYLSKNNGCDYPAVAPPPRPALPSNASGTGVAKIAFFFSPECGYCKDVKTNFMPVVQKKYGKKLLVQYYNLETVEGSTYADYLENTYHESGNYIPLVFADGKFLSGQQELTKRFEWWINDILSRNGCELPEMPKK